MADKEKSLKYPDYFNRARRNLVLYCGGVLVLVRRLTRRVRDGVAAGVVRAGTGVLDRACYGCGQCWNRSVLVCN